MIQRHRRELNDPAVKERLLREQHSEVSRHIQRNRKEIEELEREENEIKRERRKKARSVASVEDLKARRVSSQCRVSRGDTKLTFGSRQAQALADQLKQRQAEAEAKAEAERAARPPGRSYHGVDYLAGEHLEPRRISRRPDLGDYNPRDSSTWFRGDRAHEQEPFSTQYTVKGSGLSPRPNVQRPPRKGTWPVLDRHEPREPSPPRSRSASPRPWHRDLHKRAFRRGE